MTETVLALDIGGTKLAAAVVDRDGSVLGFARCPTPVSQGPRGVVDRLVALGREALASAASARPAIDEPRIVGIASGGPLDPRRGLILGAPNLPGWDEVPLVAWIEEAFGIPACLENDASAAALGEARYGAGRGVADLVYLTISTGIGGGVVIGGRLYRGSSGNAAELGHTTVALDGRPCRCGRRGCLEACASGTAIAEMAREAIEAGEASALAARRDTEITAAHVADAAFAGDPLASRVWAAAVQALGAGVANVINAFDPRLVVLGGGVVNGAGERLLGPVRRIALEQAWAPLAKGVEIRAAALGERTGVLGAAAVAWDALDEAAESRDAPLEPERDGREGRGRDGRLARWIEEHRAVVDEVETRLGPAIEQAAERIAGAFSSGGRVFTFGNGGSAAEAQHLAAEFTGHLRRERKPLPAIALTTDTSALTAIGNDYAFDDVFARQVTALAGAGDVVVAMTTSGRSPNVVRGLTAARASGATTILLSGGDGGPALAHADVGIVVSSSASTARIQEAHALIVHLLCERVDDRVLGEEPRP